MISFEPLPSTTFSGQAEFLRDGVAQVEAAAVGIKVGRLDGLVHRGHGERRGAERVFVRGELDDRGGVEAEFARDVIDRLARLVGHEVEQFAVGDVLDGNHSLICRREGALSRLRKTLNFDGINGISELTEWGGEF